jgi:DNA-binding MarR family transcriptional regulator
MTATAIGAHSAMHKTKVSRAVAALEKRLWLTRAPEESDRRVERLTLTKAGRKAYRDLVPFAKAYETQFLEAMSEPQRKAILRSLSFLEEAVGATHPKSQ